MINCSNITEFIYHALLDLKAEISKLRDDIYQLAYSEPTPKSLPSYYSEVVPRTEDAIEGNGNNEKPDEQALDDKTLEEVERVMIDRALERSDGSKRKAARALGISERTLYRKIKEYDLPY